jgi:hypothetical protein
MNLLKLLKKPKNQVPLPAYPTIEIDDIKPASALVFYGSPGNKATELVGSRLYGVRYLPVPFHAALYLSKGEFLNVGKTRQVLALKKEFKNTRRIDVIEYNIPARARKAIETAGRDDTSKVNSVLEKVIKKPVIDYAITDFLRFGFKSIPPSKKDFCSENVVENMAVSGIEVSDNKAVDTAPWDLAEWAEEHPEVATIYTLWEGDVFKKKLGRA